MGAGLTVQRVTCTCMGAGLAVRRVLWTSSQLAWECRESSARSSSQEIQPISILVPRIWFQAPHPSNCQNIPKTKPFRRLKRRLLEGARLQDFALQHIITLGGGECVLGPWRQAWPCRGYSVRPVNLHGRAGTPVHGYSQRQTVHKAFCVKFRVKRMNPDESRWKAKLRK